MTRYSWQMIAVVGLLVFLLLLVIVYFARQKRIASLEKRFDQFALLSSHDSEKSFFDIIIDIFWKFVRCLSKKLSKSVFLSNYARRYEKHIQYESRSFYTGMDYVSLKFFTGFSLGILYFVGAIIQSKIVQLMPLILVFGVGFFVPDLFLRIEYHAKRKRVEEDLLKAIIMMNNAFKSGRNIMQAVEIVMNELDGPISDEFKKIYLDMTYGLSMEVVFDRFYHRVRLEDAKYITSSLSLLNKTGGNIVKVFGSIEKNFYEKKRLSQDMQSLTAASIFVFRILCVLPFLFIAVIYLLNPNYFTPMFTTTLGYILSLLIILLYTLYIIVIKKVLEVKI
ncbi:MAG: type II secretion system F family protein [Bacilli bacterium]|nr:type II secretion system F family protein [Bacilli bacterium]